MDRPSVNLGAVGAHLALVGAHLLQRQLPVDQWI